MKTASFYYELYGFSWAWIGSQPLYPESKVSRKDWGALPSRDGARPMEAPITNVLVTHTDTETCETKEACTEIVKNIQQSHLDQGLVDIKYNFLVGGDGHVYEGRGWNTKPEVSQMYPDISDNMVDIGYIGVKGTRPDKKQRVAGKSLIKHSFDSSLLSETATFYSDL